MIKNTRLHPIQTTYLAAVALAETANELFEDGEIDDDELRDAFQIEADAEKAIIEWGVDLCVAATKEPTLVCRAESLARKFPKGLLPKATNGIGLPELQP